MKVKDFMQEHKNDKVEINCHEQKGSCVEFQARNTNQDYNMFVENYGEMVVKNSVYEKKFQRNWHSKSVWPEYFEEYWYVLEVGY